MAANPKKLREVTNKLASEKASPDEPEWKQRARDDMPTYNRLARLMIEVERGKKDLLDLADFIDAEPDLFKNLSMFGELVQNSLIEQLSGENRDARFLVLHRECLDMLDRLHQPGDSELERLMAARIVMCWLRLLYGENLMSITIGKGSIPVEHFEMVDKHLLRTHTRFIRACESLARLRKLTAKPIGSGDSLQAPVEAVKGATVRELRSLK